MTSKYDWINLTWRFNSYCYFYTIRGKDSSLYIYIPNTPGIAVPNDKELGIDYCIRGEKDERV